MDGGAGGRGIIGVDDARVDTGVIGRCGDFQFAENDGEPIVPMVGAAAEAV